MPSRNCTAQPGISRRGEVLSSLSNSCEATCQRPRAKRLMRGVKGRNMGEAKVGRRARLVVVAAVVEEEEKRREKVIEGRH